MAIAALKVREQNLWTIITLPKKGGQGLLGRPFGGCPPLMAKTAVQDADTEQP